MVAGVVVAVVAVVVAVVAVVAVVVVVVAVAVAGAAAVVVVAAVGCTCPGKNDSSKLIYCNFISDAHAAVNSSNSDNNKITLTTRTV